MARRLASSFKLVFHLRHARRGFAEADVDVVFGFGLGDLVLGVGDLLLALRLAVVDLTEQRAGLDFHPFMRLEALQDAGLLGRDLHVEAVNQLDQALGVANVGFGRRAGGRLLPDAMPHGGKPATGHSRSHMADTTDTQH